MEQAKRFIAYNSLGLGAGGEVLLEDLLEEEPELEVVGTASMITLSGGGVRGANM